MNKANKAEIMEVIKGLSYDQQETILHLTEIFKGEEEAILEYCKEEFLS